MNRNRHHLVLAGLALAGLFACDSSSSPPAEQGDVGVDSTVSDAEAEAEFDTSDPPWSPPVGCNPIAPQGDCLLPFPSDFFLVADGSTETGSRVAITEEAGIRTKDGGTVVALDAYPSDGFSHFPAILALFPGGVDDSNLPFHTDDPSLSMSPDSVTLLIEADTGTPVPHFAELDPRADSDAKRALIIRPLVRLHNATRYIVAVRGLLDHSGEPVPTPMGFSLIRDGGAEGAGLGALAERYEAEIFPTLATFGVPRAGLQLAWDFTTESQQSRTTDMLAVRSDLMAKLAISPPPVAIDEVIEAGDGFSEVHGHMTVPLYLESVDGLAPLHRDASGTVAANGETEVPFLMLIPPSVLAGEPRSGRLVQFNHGFFGERDELLNGRMRAFAEASHSVLIGVDWWGMARGDLSEIAGTLAEEPEHSMAFTDRLHQAMANQIALSYAATGPLSGEEAIAIDGEPPFDPSAIYLYGISNGHILGGIYLALAPKIERAVLGSGGAAYSFIMFRSNKFVAFGLILQSVYADALEQQKFASFAQIAFDRMDPITYAPWVTSDTLEGGPASRHVLMQIGIGDPAVPNVASHLHARAMGLSLMSPGPRSVTLLDEVSYPYEGSALVEFDFGIADPLPGTYADFGTGATQVHTGVRGSPAGVEMIDAFLRPDGAITDTCGGPCVIE